MLSHPFLAQVPSQRSLGNTLGFPQICPYKAHNQVHISSIWSTSIWADIKSKIIPLEYENQEFLQYIIHNSQFTKNITRYRKKHENKKNAVHRDQHWHGPDFGFKKQKIYYKYIQITKGKYFKELKKDTVFRMNKEGILYRKLEYIKISKWKL